MPEIKIVIDTNILIDLCIGNLMESFLDLPFTFLIPDVIKEEFLQPEGCVKEIEKIKVCSLESEDVQKVYGLSVTYKGPSINDYFSLVLAEKEGAVLLTGDKKLREIGEKNGIEVHGILWVMDILFEKECLKGDKLIKALERILEGGSRLPEEECKKRIRKWKKRIKK